MSKSKQFWLAWSTAFLAAQIWLFYYLPSPQMQNGSPWALRNLATMETVVAAISVISVLAVAQFVERLFEKRGYGTLRATFWYFVGLGGISLLGFVLGSLVATLSHNWVLGTLPMAIGVAAFASTPVAVIARLLYPAVIKSRALSIAVVAISGSIALTSFVATFWPTH